MKIFLDDKIVDREGRRRGSGEDRIWALQTKRPKVAQQGHVLLFGTRVNFPLWQISSPLAHTESENHGESWFGGNPQRSLESNSWHFTNSMVPEMIKRFHLVFLMLWSRPSNTMNIWWNIFLRIYIRKTFFNLSTSTLKKVKLKAHLGKQYPGKDFSTVCKEKGKNKGKAILQTNITSIHAIDSI